MNPIPSKVLPPSESEPPLFNKNLAGILALAGAFVPGLQRFYLKQTRWGFVYLALGLCFLPIFPIWLQVISYGVRLLCFAEGLWLLSMDNIDFHPRFNAKQTQLEWTSVRQKPSSDPEVQLDIMFREGLLNEKEYHQQRQLLRSQGRKDSSQKD